jgi:surfactin synthase thioesterase subunit
MNIFFLPFAGASKYSYNGFISKAPEPIRPIAVELPGRGSRYREDLLFDIGRQVDDVYDQIKDLLHEPYAIYGHSMGSLIGYLLARKIVRLNLRKPERLFFSGCTAPSLKPGNTAHSLLPRDAFYGKIREYGGCPDEMLNNSDLMVFFEPILRADFQAVESFRYTPEEPFDMPIDIFLGTEENITAENALAWQKETTAKISVSRFAGRHFFIFDHEKELMEHVAFKMTHTGETA